MAKAKKIETDDVELDGPEDIAKASFLIHDGTKELRVQAYADCWALQRWKEAGEDSKSESRWVNFKYFVDLGSLVNKIFSLRLKNSESTTLVELAETAKQISADIRREFGLK